LSFGSKLNILDLKKNIDKRGSNINKIVKTSDPIIPQILVVAKKIGSKFSRSLLTWYGHNKRTLPWRTTKNPYKIWVSEIMLQQTQVAQVIPYYKRFLKKFPSIEALSAAKQDEVLKIWEGMGYYRRARYIHEAAKIIIKKYSGIIPNNYDALKKLPGFGPYTCGAVLSIAYNLPYPAVDGNVARFISRLFRISADVSNSTTKKVIEELVRILFPEKRAAEFTQALMEMGALICTPTLPACRKCCCRSFCRAYKELADPSVLPIRRPSKKKARIQLSVGIVRKGNLVLISKRPANVILGNLWEFPGGKIEKGETPKKACIREVKKKTGLTVKPIRLQQILKHQYSHYGITLHFFVCKYMRGALKNKRFRWVNIQDLSKFAFSKTHKLIAAKLMEE
jgi:A/G-specific adenine glycosylase